MAHSNEPPRTKTVFPPLYKKRITQGIAVYALLACAAGGWLYLDADSARVAWDAKVPHAETAVAALGAANGDGTSPTAPDAPTLGAPPAVTGDTVSIIMTGIGLSSAATDRALHDLPAAVAIGISPYAQNIQSIAAQARDTHHDTILMIPMEPNTYPLEDPGPQALLTGASEDENIKRLGALLDAGQGIDIAMNAMGSRFLGDKKNMNNVMSALHKRGLRFIEASGGGLPQASLVAIQSQVPYAAADIVIDSNANAAQIQQALVELEDIAHKQGHALAIAHPYPVTFDTLKDWAPTLRNVQLSLVPPASLFQPMTPRDATNAGQQEDTP